jgi:hypothetical protein
LLVLLSFFLVLVATVLLVLGLLNDGGLALIYISIACSAAAALVLVVAVRMARPKDERAAATPQPLPGPGTVPAPTAVAATPDLTAVVPVASAPTPASGEEWLAGDQDEWEEGVEEGEELDFPIAEYDTLTVNQILPLLPRLYSDELEVVEERERAGKGRVKIMAKIVELRAAGGADEEAPDVDVVEDAWEDDDFFPIEDYDTLSIGQIRPLLGELEPDELEVVRDREAAGAARAGILSDIDRRLGVAPAPASKAAAVTKKAPVIKKAAPAKRVATPSRPPAKKAAPVRSAPPAKRAATPTKAVAKKAAPAKRAAAPAPKAAASVKKAAVVKRAPAPAKKSAPARKAAPTKKAAKKAARR